MYLLHAYQVLSPGLRLKIRSQCLAHGWKTNPVTVNRRHATGTCKFVCRWRTRRAHRTIRQFSSHAGRTLMESCHFSLPAPKMRICGMSKLSSRYCTASCKNNGPVGPQDHKTPMLGDNALLTGLSLLFDAGDGALKLHVRFNGFGELHSPISS